MIELQPFEYNKVAPLFADIDHSLAIVYAVLEGNSHGRVFVENPDLLTCAFLLAEGAFYYVAGDEHNQAFCQALSGLIFDEILPSAGDPEVVLFSFSPAWHQRLAELLKHKGVITIHRKMFHFNVEKFRVHRDWRAEIPVGFALRKIDQLLAERYPAYRPLLEPATRRFGYCLMDGETVACECNAVFVGHAEAEIDIHTVEQYRGRGFARLTACAFIEECLRSGLTPNWACWPEREASWKLALRLGFDELPDVPALLWAEDL